MGAVGSFLKPLNFKFEKEDAVKTGRFLLYFMIAYIALSVAIRSIFSIPGIELWTANNVLAGLQLFGQQGIVSLAETALIELDSGIVIEISELCTGLMETLVIVAAILASVGIGWRKRLLGAAIAAVATIALNHVRIIVTSLLILGSADLLLIEFTHNVLFRLFLFISIAVLYIAWFYWAVSSEVEAKKGQ